jgi:hypothetical protein
MPNIPSDAIEIYLDFEGIPEQKFIYLIGLVIKEGTETKSMSFWANSEADEAIIFCQLFDKLEEVGEFFIYHYGSYELQALKIFDKKNNGIYEKQVNLIVGKSINILSYFVSVIHPPTYTNELKEIARFLGFEWSSTEASGIQSLVWRKRWEFTNDQHFKELLVQYNIEDCEALKLTKDWIQSIEPRFNQEENDNIIDSSSIIQVTRKWGSVDFKLPGFKEISRSAHFEYQRNKIYVRTNKRIKRAVRIISSKNSLTNKIDKVVTLKPGTCPSCGEQENFENFSGIRKIIDLKFMKHGIKKWVVKYKRTRFKCGRCGQRFSPNPVRDAPMHGRNLAIWAINQNVSYDMSFRKIEQMLVENFRVSCPAEMQRFRTRLANEYRSTLDEILHELLAGRLIHADETTASVKGLSSPYVWVLTNMDSVYYLFRPSRESAFLKELLKGFSGVLISDFYNGYDSMPCTQQKCLIHLIRDLNEDLSKNQFDLEFKDFALAFGKLIQLIIKTVDMQGLRALHLTKHNADVDEFYRTYIDRDYKSTIAESYRTRFVRYKDRLFVFLNHDGIPWNNNNAEAAIKPFASYRTRMIGQFAQKGLEDYLVLLSIQQTCRYRGINFFDFLKSGRHKIGID